MIRAVGILPTVDQLLHRDLPLGGPKRVLKRPLQRIRPVVEEMRDFSLSPFGFVSLQTHNGFNHVERRWISRAIRAAGFAIDAHHFGKRLDQLVGLLKNLPRRRHADARIGCWHVEQITFIQRRHELAAELPEWPDGRRDKCDRRDNQDPSKPDRRREERIVDRLQGVADRISILVNDPLRNQQHPREDGPANAHPPAIRFQTRINPRQIPEHRGGNEHGRERDEQVELPSPLFGQHAGRDEIDHQHRDDRDRKDRRCRHREGLGERKGLK